MHCRRLPERSPRTTRPLLLSILALFASATLLVAAEADEPPPLPTDITFATLDGEELTLGDLRGQVVLIDFWATWCKPCHQAEPSLRRIAKRLSDKPFVLIGVSIDRDEEAMRRHLAEAEIDWPQVWDRTAQLTHQTFGISKFPSFLILDHEGRPAGMLQGWGDGYGENLSLAVQREVRRARKAAKQAEKTASAEG